MEKATRQRKTPVVRLEVFALNKLVLGVLSSGRAKDLHAVIEAIEAGKLEAEIACVVSNKENATVLELAKKHEIDATFLDPKEFDSNEAFDKKLAEILNEKKVELVLLIGYNKFLTEPFLNEFENRAMNIHPSLLPAFKGWDRNVHQKVLDAGCKVSGCTLFFVNKDPDGGPIIMQKSVELAENETVDSLKEKVQKAEQEIILKSIKLFQEQKLSVEGKKVRLLG